MAPPILAALLTPDQSRPAARRLLAALGLIAFLLALGVRGDVLTMLMMGLAGVFFTGLALHGRNLAEVRRFAIVNGAAILILAWAAAERTDLIVDRTPEQLTVTMGTVQLGASVSPTALSRGSEDRIAIGLTGLDARPFMAAWVYDQLPRLSPFGYWLGGGMRAGIGPVRVVDSGGTDLVPPLPYTLQPDASADPPLVPGLPDGWTVDRAADGTVLLVSPPFSARQFRLEAPVSRPSATVLVALGEPGAGPALDVLVAPDRRQFEIVAREPDGAAERLVGGPFTYRRTSIGWIQALLREIGRAWLVGLALVASVRLVAFRMPTTVPVPFPGAGDVLVLIAAAAIGLAVLTLASMVALFVLEGIPHTLESVAFAFQGQVMALGRLWAPAPELPQFFEEPYILIRNGRWFGVLPPGQSLLLAVGVLGGAPWVISPLVTANAVALTIIVGRGIYGRMTGVMAGLLLLFSPFVLLLSGDMLPHPAALLLTVLIALGVAIGRSTAPVAGAVLAGFAAGCLLATRPLAFVGAGIPLLLLLLWGDRREQLRSLAMRAGMVAAGALLPVLFYAFVNASLTGSPFVTASAIWSDVDRVGFGDGIGARGGHDLASGLGNAWANTVVLERHLFGWPSYLTLALAMVPFIRGTRHLWDWALLASAVGLLASHLLYWSDGILFGPRFAFEAVAALALLTARGFALLGEPGLPPDATVGSAMPPQSPKDPSAPRLTAAPIVALFAATLIAVNLIAYLPDVVLAYHGYNGISRDGLRAIEEGGLQNGLVFVTSTGEDWQSYAQVFLANGPLLDRTVIFARNLGDGENYQLIGQYPGWSAWILERLHLREVR